MAITRPLDPNFPIERQLGIDAAPIVLVIAFTVDKADEEALLDAVQAQGTFMKQQPGFISSQVHRAVGDGATYFIYAVWESTKAFGAAFAHPNFQPLLAALPSSAVVSPHLFQKIAVPGLSVA